MKEFQKGMTLIELTVVLLILIALAGLAIPYVGGTSRMALCQATDASMHAVKIAIMGGGANTGFYMDTLGYYPQNTPDKQDHNDYDLRYLFEPTGFKSTYNPKTAIGWRGPYLMSGGKPPTGLDNSFQNFYDPSTATENVVHTDIISSDGSRVLDAWGRPIIIQVPYSIADSEYKPDNARLVSAGPGNGIAPGDAAINTAIHDNQDADDRDDDRILFLKNPDPIGNQPCNE